MRKSAKMKLIILMDSSCGNFVNARGRPRDGGSLQCTVFPETSRNHYVQFPPQAHCVLGARTSEGELEERIAALLRGSLLEQPFDVVKSS